MDKMADVSGGNGSKDPDSQDVVLCPVCEISLEGYKEADIYGHVESCLGREALAEANSPTELSSEEFDDPFKLICPYPGCGLGFQASDFPIHAVKAHLSEPQQNYACPICSIWETFTPSANTNLLQHVQHSHQDLIPKSNPPPPSTVSAPTPRVTPQKANDLKSPKLAKTSPTKRTKKPKPTIETPDPQYTTLSSQYIVAAYTGVTAPFPECGICYEEILNGNQIARLSCFCLYHNKCAQAWFTKKGSPACPFHMLRGDD